MSPFNVGLCHPFDKIANLAYNIHVERGNANMPRIYRAMLADGDKPVVGDKNNMLGVRIPPHPRYDIIPGSDADMTVKPKSGGMSVNPSISAIPMVFIPPTYRQIDPNRYRSARGDESIAIFRMGEGEFVEAALTERLILRPDSPRHGLVEPSNDMALSDYQDALSDTRDNWIILHQPDGS